MAIQVFKYISKFLQNIIVPDGIDSNHAVNVGQMNSRLIDKVDKVAGKQLSTEDYTSAEKTKLGNIQDGAEVNVQTDWDATSGDAVLLNKPTIPTNNNQLTNGSGYITATALTDYATQSYVTSQGYQNASQVSAEITNQISALGLAPEGFEFFHAAPTIDTDRYREVIANYSGSSFVNIDVTNPQYNGVVLTVQAGDNQLNLTIDCLLGNVMRTDDEVLPGMATTYVFSDSLGVWVRRSMNKEF